MKGHFYRRGCKCNKKKCTCGSKWAFTIDIGIDPITGKRKMYQYALNDLKDQGLSDSTRGGINRTGRMIFRKALELEMIKKDPTEFAYVKNDKKTIEQLEEEEVPKYLEKEELALI